MDITLPETAHALGIQDESLDAVHTGVVALVAERDRLARILAVERGDKSAAPDGWRSPLSNWYRGKNDNEGLFCATRRAGRCRHKWDVYRDGELVADGFAATALEAMEAADAAAGVGQ